MYSLLCSDRALRRMWLVKYLPVLCPVSKIPLNRDWIGCISHVTICGWSHSCVKNSQIIGRVQGLGMLGLWMTWTFGGGNVSAINMWLRRYNELSFTLLNNKNMLMGDYWTYMLVYADFSKNTSKNPAYGQHSALSYVCDILPKMVNTVNKGQNDLKKRSTTVNNGQQRSIR